LKEKSEILRENVFMPDFLGAMVVPPWGNGLPTQNKAYAPWFIKD